MQETQEAQEIPVNKKEIESLKKVLNTVAFIHHKLVTTSFYPEEFEAAKHGLEWLQKFATELDEKIIELDPELKKKVEEQKEAAKKDSKNG